MTEKKPREIHPVALGFMKTMYSTRQGMDADVVPPAVEEHLWDLGMIQAKRVRHKKWLSLNRAGRRAVEAVKPKWPESMLAVTVLRPRKHELLFQLKEGFDWDLVCMTLKPGHWAWMEREAKRRGCSRADLRDRQVFTMALMKGEPKTVLEAVDMAKDLSDAESAAGEGARREFERRSIGAAERSAGQRPGNAPGGSWDRSER